MSLDKTTVEQIARLARLSVGADDQISKPEVSQLAIRAKNLAKQMLGLETA